MTSRTEAKQLAGERLKIVPIGQPMQAQHDTRMGEAYDEVYAQLQVKGLAVWDSTGEMPDELSPYFVTLMAQNKMEIYTVSDPLYQRITFKAGPDGEKAIGNIRNLVNGSYISEDEQTDF
jgi:hypothetical protein